MASNSKKSQTIYNEDYQILFLQALISNNEMYLRCQNILKPSYFDPKLRSTLRYIMDYTSKYLSMPTPAQIKAETGIVLELIDNPTSNFYDWFLDHIETFCRHKEFEDLILSGPELLMEGNHAIIEKRAKDAMTISLQRDLGVSYFSDPQARLEQYKNTNNAITTGWKTLDKHLNGGWGRQTLNIFAGQSGAGKSMVMQNLAVNYIEMGMNVVIFTLEMSELAVCERMDSMFTGVKSYNIMREIDDVSLKLCTYKRTKKPGQLQIKKFPEGGTTTNDLRAYLKEYEIQTGIKFDVVIVDYLDLIYPNSRRIDPSDLFVKDKYTTEELRGLMFEYDAIGITGSQLNRSSIEIMEFDHSHIAGGISKINTADNVVAILATKAMKERGEYQFQFLKSRKAAATGYKVTMDYNNDSLRITDRVDPDANDGSETLNNSQLQDRLRSMSSGTTTTNRSASSSSQASQQPTNVRALMDTINRIRND